MPASGGAPASPRKSRLNGGKVTRILHCRASDRSLIQNWIKENEPMKTIHEGQCGLCAHFGEDHPGEHQLVQIRQGHSAPEDFVEECGHPRHASLNLKVTPISGCDGFLPAEATSRY